MKKLYLLKNYFKKFKPHVAYYLMLVILVKISMVILPYILGKFVDDINKYNSIDYITSIGVTIAVIGIISIIVNYNKEVLATKIVSKVSFNFINDTVEHIKKLPIDYFRGLDTIYLNQRINQDASVIMKFIISDIVELILQLISLITILIIIFNISSLLFLSIILIIPINIILYLVFKKKLYTVGYSLQETQNKFFSKVNDQFNIINSIKRNSWFKKLNDEIKEGFDNFYKSAIKYTRIDKLYSEIGEFLKYICIVSLVTLGGYQIINNSITVGSFVILSSYFIMILDITKFILTFGSGYQSYLVAYNRMNEIINVPEEHNGEQIITKINKIHINNLEFGYQDKDLIVSNFKFEFEKGKVYCIKGGNGRGKSTLLDILIGMRYDYNGDIYYDDLNIKEIDMYNCRHSLIGVVEQEPNLSNDTIKNNLTYDLDVYDELRLDELCSLMDIKGILEDENNNLKNNQSISGGEKQKISEIRVLLKNPELILLDEPISALDIASIEKLKKVINYIKKDTIVILVTHNESILDIIDEVIEL